MGIKKNAFFRHFVRSRLAFEKEWRAMFFNEIEPAWARAKGNVDQAVKIVLSEPTRFPILNNFSFTKDRLEAVLDTAAQLSFSSRTEPNIDILQNARENRAPLPRAADLKSPSERFSPAFSSIAPDKFFQVLKANESSIFEVLSPVDKQDISKILEGGYTPEQKIEEIHKILKVAWIRGFFENFEGIRERIQRLSPQPVKEAGTVYRVIFDYLDSLE
jgi:hypothetical protein